MLTTIHCIKSTSDCSYLSYSQFFNFLVEFLNCFKGDLRWSVASIQKHVNKNLGQSLFSSQPHQSVQMFDMTVNPASARQSHQMQGRIIFFDMLGGGQQYRIRKKTPVINR